MWEQGRVRKLQGYSTRLQEREGGALTFNGDKGQVCVDKGLGVQAAREGHQGRVVEDGQERPIVCGVGSCSCSADSPLLRLRGALHDLLGKQEGLEALQGNPGLKRGGWGRAMLLARATSFRKGLGQAGKEEARQDEPSQERQGTREGGHLGEELHHPGEAREGSPKDRKHRKRCKGLRQHRSTRGMGVQGSMRTDRVFFYRRGLMGKRGLVT